MSEHKRVYEYDGSFKCLDCESLWGALPGNPKEPKECKVKKEEVPLLDRMAEALREIQWMFDGEIDIDDNGNPNRAMTIDTTIEPLLAEYDSMRGKHES